MTKSLSSRKKQSGAALIIGLLLLMVLTLLAVSTMNTANLELIMAGNEQYRTRAFNAAETGIETSVRLLTISTSAVTAPTTVTLGSDTYTYGIAPLFDGHGQQSPPRTTLGSFETLYFLASSTGNSGRGAVASTTQEFYEVAPASGEMGRDTNACAGSDALSASRTAC